jgi:acyl dehydratase
VALNLDALGTEWDGGELAWTSSDAMLYALAVGAGTDPVLAMQDLPFVTENSLDTPQQVLPTFGAALVSTDMGPGLGSFDPAMLLHSEQSVEICAPLPVSGTARTTTRMAEVQDKGRDAVVTLEYTVADNATGKTLIRTRSGFFIRGEGGFGGDRGTSEPWQPPQRAPDAVVTYHTTSQQALLFRLTGDRNPLHSDPKFAARAGFPRPILHGMCTYGFTGRALLHAAANSDPAAFVSMRARFASPVMPGESLSVLVWNETDGTLFQAKVDDRIVLDRGILRTH